MTKTRMPYAVGYMTPRGGFQLGKVTLKDLAKIAIDLQGMSDEERSEQVEGSREVVHEALSWFAGDTTVNAVEDGLLWSCMLCLWGESLRTCGRVKFKKENENGAFLLCILLPGGTIGMTSASPLRK